MVEELENKYFVLKGNDIGKFLTKDEMFQLHDLSMKISEGRKAEGKHDNEYVVLNLADPIDLSVHSSIMDKMLLLDDDTGDKRTVEDIALSLVDSIVKAKD